MTDTTVMGAQGRVVVPADLRARLGLVPGEQLSIRVERRSLILQRPADAAAELRGLVRSAASGRSLVDELLAERRDEASSGG